MSESPSHHSPSPEEVARSISGSSSRGFVWVIALVVTVGVGVAAFLFTFSKDAEVQYQTAEVDRGSLIATATATGTLEARGTVTVGAEISGLVKTVHVEDSATVQKDQLLATFDTTNIETDLRQSKASLASSQASQRRAKAAYAEAKSELERTRTLVSRGVSARAELDTWKATVAKSKADLDKAAAEVSRAKSSLAEVELQLGKAEIRSPIDGIVLDRNIEPGQTVASSLQAPELFKVAENLDHMELQIWIDEADIGVVKVGQKAEFEVAAWTNRTFPATIESIDLSPTTTNNVVTYLTILTVENDEKLLRPGMTATATITTKSEDDVLRVSNSALRYKPSNGEKKEQEAFSLIPAPGPRGGGKKRQATDERRSTGQVYVLRASETEPAPVRVQLGMTDGKYTAIRGGELEAGDKVVTGVNDATKKGGK